MVAMKKIMAGLLVLLMVAEPIPFTPFSKERRAYAALPSSDTTTMTEGNTTSTQSEIDQQTALQQLMALPSPSPIMLSPSPAASESPSTAQFLPAASPMLAAPITDPSPTPVPVQVIDAAAKALGVSAGNLVGMQAVAQPVCQTVGCPSWSYLIDFTLYLNGVSTHYVGVVTDGNMLGVAMVMQPPKVHLIKTVFKLEDVQAIMRQLGINDLTQIREIKSTDLYVCTGTGCPRWSRSIEITVQTANGINIYRGTVTQNTDPTLPRYAMDLKLWKQILPDGTVKEFDTQGRLVTVNYPNGDRLNISWASMRAYFIPKDGMQITYWKVDPTGPINIKDSGVRGRLLYILFYQFLPNTMIKKLSQRETFNADGSLELRIKYDLSTGKITRVEDPKQGVFHVFWNANFTSARVELKTPAGQVLKAWEDVVDFVSVVADGRTVVVLQLRGRLVLQRMADGSVRHYDREGRVIKIEFVNGDVFEMDWATNRATMTKRTEGGTVKIMHWENVVASEINADDGRQAIFDTGFRGRFSYAETFDSLGRIIFLEVPGKGTVEFDWNTNTAVRRYLNGLVKTWTNMYVMVNGELTPGTEVIYSNIAGQLRREQMPDGSAKEYEYSATGELIKITAFRIGLIKATITFLAGNKVQRIYTYNFDGNRINTSTVYSYQNDVLVQSTIYRNTGTVTSPTEIIKVSVTMHVGPAGAERILRVWTYNYYGNQIKTIIVNSYQNDMLIMSTVYRNTGSVTAPTEVIKLSKSLFANGKLERVFNYNFDGDRVMTTTIWSPDGLTSTTYQGEILGIPPTNAIKLSMSEFDPLTGALRKKTTFIDGNKATVTDFTGPKGNEKAQMMFSYNAAGAQILTTTVFSYQSDTLVESTLWGNVDPLTGIITVASMKLSFTRFFGNIGEEVRWKTFELGLDGSVKTTTIFSYIFDTLVSSTMYRNTAAPGQTPTEIIKIAVARFFGNQGAERILRVWTYNYYGNQIKTIIVNSYQNDMLIMSTVYRNTGSVTAPTEVIKLSKSLFANGKLERVFNYNFDGDRVMTTTIWSPDGLTSTTYRGEILGVPPTTAVKLSMSEFDPITGALRKKTTYTTDGNKATVTDYTGPKGNEKAQKMYSYNTAGTQILTTTVFSYQFDTLVETTLWGNVDPLTGIITAASMKLSFTRFFGNIGEEVRWKTFELGLDGSVKTTTIFSYIFDTLVSSTMYRNTAAPGQTPTEIIKIAVARFFGNQGAERLLRVWTYNFDGDQIKTTTVYSYQGDILTNSVTYRNTGSVTAPTEVIKLSTSLFANGRLERVFNYNFDGNRVMTTTIWSPDGLTSTTYQGEILGVPPTTAVKLSMSEFDPFTGALRKKTTFIAGNKATVTDFTGPKGNEKAQKMFSYNTAGTQIMTTTVFSYQFDVLVESTLWGNVDPVTGAITANSIKLSITRFIGNEGEELRWKTFELGMDGSVKTTTVFSYIFDTLVSSTTYRNTAALGQTPTEFIKIAVARFFGNQGAERLQRVWTYNYAGDMIATTTVYSYQLDTLTHTVTYRNTGTVTAPTESVKRRQTIYGGIPGQEFVREILNYDYQGTQVMTREMFDPVTGRFNFYIVRGLPDPVPGTGDDILIIQNQIVAEGYTVIYGESIEGRFGLTFTDLRSTQNVFVAYPETTTVVLNGIQYEIFILSTGTLVLEKYIPDDIQRYLDFMQTHLGPDYRVSAYRYPGTKIFHVEWDAISPQPQGRFVHFSYDLDTTDPNRWPGLNKEFIYQGIQSVPALMFYEATQILDFMVFGSQGGIEVVRDAIILSASESEIILVLAGIQYRVYRDATGKTVVVAQ